MTHDKTTSPYKREETDRYRKYSKYSYTLFANNFTREKWPLIPQITVRLTNYQVRTCRNRLVSGSVYVVKVKTSRNNCNQTKSSFIF